MNRDDLTWTCHLCGDERPDHLIKVAKAEQVIVGGAKVSVNVRYCSDRVDCITEARPEAQRRLDTILAGDFG